MSIEQATFAKKQKLDPTPTPIIPTPVTQAASACEQTEIEFVLVNDLESLSLEQSIKILYNLGSFIRQQLDKGFEYTPCIEKIALNLQEILNSNGKTRYVMKNNYKYIYNDIFKRFIETIEKNSSYTVSGKKIVWILILIKLKTHLEQDKYFLGIIFKQVQPNNNFKIFLDNLASSLKKIKKENKPSNSFFNVPTTGKNNRQSRSIYFLIEILGSEINNRKKHSISSFYSQLLRIIEKKN